MSFAKQMPMPRGRAENLAVIFGDQLDHDAGLLKRLDPENDVILMAEVDGEQDEGPSHKVRTAVFFAAMRHYALWLSERGFRVRYVRVDSRGNTQSLEGEINRAIDAHKPQRLLVTHPGDWRVMETLDAIDA
ncbi:MAG: cryptochrome/photolyase family protein, partial [Planctomycetota bacterium]